MNNTNHKEILLYGSPISHSPSPRMHNLAYKALGIDLEYKSQDINEESLYEAIKAIKSDLYVGCAITKPNKVAVMDYLDDFDDICRKIGSANTVVKSDDGKLIGYNTDGYGAVKSLISEIGGINGHRFLILGAGGTGKSVAYELANTNAAYIYIYDISNSASYELAQNVISEYGHICESVRYEDIDGLKNAINKAEVIMNLTGLGMKGMENETPIDKSLLNKNHICFDATYNPNETRFLSEAKSIGCKTINGKDMLIYQAAKQIKLWTGKDADIDILRQGFNT